MVLIFTPAIFKPLANAKWLECGGIFGFRHFWAGEACQAAYLWCNFLFPPFLGRWVVAGGLNMA